MVSKFYLMEPKNKDSIEIKDNPYRLITLIIFILVSRLVKYSFMLIQKQ